MTYRVLIYIFEVGMKTFFLKWEIAMSKSQFEKKNQENGLFLFWGWRLNFFLSPCHHERHLQQIHWFKIFCRMYGLVVMLTIPSSSPMSLINKIGVLWYECNCTVNVNVIVGATQKNKSRQSLPYSFCAITYALQQ